MKLPFLLSLWLSISALGAAEPKPVLTKPGTLLLQEDFSAPSLPEKWQPGGKPKAFSIVEGALQGVCAPDDGHGPAIGVPITGRDLTFAFRVKVTQPGYFLFLVDGDSQFGGAAHLLRVGLSAAQLNVAQDCGSLASKAAQKQAKDEAAKEGSKPTPPTKEQLADPQFYRTESLVHQAGKFADGQWHQVLVELSGNDVAVQVDDQPALRATGSVLDAKKSRIVFLVGQAGTVLIDDVKVWESSRLQASRP